MSARVVAVPGLDPASYTRHALHHEGCAWPEKNCYADLWVEVVHALGLDPLAMLGFVFALDFEGDQWTFFKPPHAELRQLYGLDVQELTVYRPLVEHAVEHLGAGKLVATEADAWWLPDTAGTDYRHRHTKTTIVLNDLDVAARRLGYFHNGGYHVLGGEDFVQTFRLDAAPDPAFLPLFAEFVRVERVVKREPAELHALATRLLAGHLAWRPRENPVARFGARFAADLPALTARGLDAYHLWAFACTRQLGAAMELAAAHVRWLAAGPLPALAPAAADLDLLSAGAKAFILKAARAVNTRKPLDATAIFADLAAAWQRALELVATHVPPAPR